MVWAGSRPRCSQKAQNKTRSSSFCVQLSSWGRKRGHRQCLLILPTPSEINHPQQQSSGLHLLGGGRPGLHRSRCDSAESLDPSFHSFPARRQERQGELFAGCLVVRSSPDPVVWSGKTHRKGAVL